MGDWLASYRGLEVIRGIALVLFDDPKLWVVDEAATPSIAVIKDGHVQVCGFLEQRL
jgi:hypothetical protein